MTQQAQHLARFLLAGGILMLTLACDKSAQTPDSNEAVTVSNEDSNSTTATVAPPTADATKATQSDDGDGSSENAGTASPIAPGTTAQEEAIELRAPESTVDQDSATVSGNQANNEAEVEPEKPTIEIPDTWKRLGKTEEIWIDTKNKEVIVGGKICLKAGPLEMFMCPSNTKEHESVVSANAPSSMVHSCLLALRHEPGKPTSWDPEYRAAFGPSIEVTMVWKDEESGKEKRINAKQWIRHAQTKKAMSEVWVFGGSGFWQDPDTKQNLYYADSGEMICLSNFSTAMIDLTIESSQNTGGLIFEAFTENIPPVNTKVYAIIKPGKVVGKPTAEDSASSEKSTKQPEPVKDTVPDKPDAGGSESQKSESKKKGDGDQ